MTTSAYQPSNIRTIFHLREKVPHLSQCRYRASVHLMTGTSRHDAGRTREFWLHQNIRSSLWILTMVDRSEGREFVIAWSRGTPNRKFGSVPWQMMDAWGKACLRNQADPFTVCADLKSDLLKSLPVSCLTQSAPAGSPLHEAAETGDRKLAAWLLNRGDDVKSKDVLGRTPLHVAVQNCHWDVARLLLKKDLHGMVQDPDGRTAWDLPTSRVRAELQMKSASIPSVDEWDLWQSLPDPTCVAVLSANDLAEILEQPALRWAERGDSAVAAIFALRIMLLEGAGIDVMADALSLWASVIPESQRQEEWRRVLSRLLASPGILLPKIAMAICRCQAIRNILSGDEIEQLIALMQSMLATTPDGSRQAEARFAISELESLKGDYHVGLQQISLAINVGSLP